jgi:hypothetical protein
MGASIRGWKKRLRRELFLIDQLCDVNGQSACRREAFHDNAKQAAFRARLV